MNDLNRNKLIGIGDLNILLKNWNSEFTDIKNDIVNNWGNSSDSGVIFVSLDGNDDNNGSIISPVKTLTKAIELANDNDTIYLRGKDDQRHHYFDETNVNKSVTITKYKDESPVIDGTKSLRDLTDHDGWTKLENTPIINDNNTLESVTLYKIKLKKGTRVWQCFHNRDEVISARYPSAQWRDNSVYAINSSERPTRWCWGYDKIVSGSNPPYENGEIKDYFHDNINLRTFVDSIRNNIISDFTLQNALIHLNVGSFRSYTKTVKSMNIDTPEEIKLTYDPTEEWKTKHHHYYLENKLEFLNSENEWFYNKTSNDLYIRLFNDDEPTLDNIRLKTQSYAIDISHQTKTLDNVSIENLNFFGTTLKANNTSNLTIKNCNFLYPSCYGHMLNEINVKIIDPESEPESALESEIFTNMTKITSSGGCQLYQCSFKYADGSAVEIEQGNKNVPNKIEDCYFSYIDKKCTDLISVMVSVRMTGNGSIFKNNTIHKTGASATVNVGDEAEISYNDISNTGYLQSDGAMIHCMTAQQKNVKVHHNWVHDTIKYGIRFDGNGNSEGGFIHHNIGWNCEGGIMVKGGRQDPGKSWGGHYIFNNTIFNSIGKNDILVLNEQSGQPINYNTRVVRNLSTRLSGHRTDPVRFKDRIYHSGNYLRDGEDEIIDINEILTDVDNNIFSVVENSIVSNDFEPQQEPEPEADPHLIPTYMLENLTESIGAVHNGQTFSTGVTWASGQTKNVTIQRNRFSFVEQSSERILEGTMVHNNFEGGFWGFISDYGEKYLLINQNAIDDKIKYNKLKVKIKVNVTEFDMSFYMWGNYIVDFIETIEIFSQPKPKILCLHGGGDNAQDFESQQGMSDLINALPQYDFVFINAPIGNAQNGYIWLSDPPGGKEEPTTDINWAQESIELIDNYVSDNGPFYGLLGYSQGAAMTIVYSAYSKHRFDCLMMFNGYLPTTHNGLMDTINNNKPFYTPALNFVGQLDDFYDLGKKITQSYFTNIKEVDSDIAGHHLPYENLYSGSKPDFPKTQIKAEIESEPEPNPHFIEVVNFIKTTYTNN